MARVHNFSAGPAVLPLSVIEQLRGALLDLGGSGIGLMEISHRSKTFQAVVDSAVARIKRVLSVPDDYTVLFLQGGASLQFYMAPLNLLRPGEASDYLVTGTWSKKAIKEAKRIGPAAAAWTDEPNNFKRVPRDDEYGVRPESVYLHYTSNNTIFGTEFRRTPDAKGKPLLADLSSDIAGVPVDIAAHQLVYAGAQKNLGPSGVTLAILSPWALERAGENLPAMLDYKVHAKDGSLYNTPNCVGIYVIERVFAWMEDHGGLPAMIERNRQKAGLLYGELDRTGFWRPHAEPASRSFMNVTWRLGTEALEETFVKDAKAAGMDGLKGHRSVGGIRASLYNALEPASVAVLVDFMRDFERRHG